MNFLIALLFPSLLLAASPWEKFVIPGQYTLKENSSAGCLASMVTFESKKKLLKIGSQYGFFLKTEKKTIPSGPKLSCKMTVDTNLKSKANSVIFTQVENEKCKSHRNTFTTSLEVKEGWIKLEQKSAEKSFECTWIRATGNSEN